MAPRSGLGVREREKITEKGKRGRASAAFNAQVLVLVPVRRRRQFDEYTSSLASYRRQSVRMEVQITTRQAMLDKLRRPFASRRLNRMWTVAQMNLTRNSGYYALVSSLMCLCLIGLRTNVDYADELDADLHYSLHNWEPSVRYLLFSFMDPICIYPTYRRRVLPHRPSDPRKPNPVSFVPAEGSTAQRKGEGNFTFDLTFIVFLTHSIYRCDRGLSIKREKRRSFCFGPSTTGAPPLTSGSARGRSRAPAASGPIARRPPTDCC